MSSHTHWYLKVDVRFLHGKVKEVRGVKNGILIVGDSRDGMCSPSVLQ